ncbi:hypothetical protein SAMN05444165_3131 [Paraburkholderia phenazinium]|uniref:Uncharacterized protein n=1 Tax=Paraburkholderia phenazinium TaxID=60549 RepID=A0A1N6JG23_9BURK|nr:hypothetical protein SAMN05444165_3131 [Paraburkholderia phenazinium]
MKPFTLCAANCMSLPGYSVLKAAELVTNDICVKVATY